MVETCIVVVMGVVMLGAGIFVWWMENHNHKD